MKTIISVTILGMFAGLVAMGLYIATAVEPVVWSAAVLMLAGSVSFDIAAFGVARIVRARHAPANPAQITHQHVEQMLVMDGGTPWERIEPPRGRGR